MAELVATVVQMETTPTSEGRVREHRVLVEVRAAGLAPDVLDKLVTIAERGCIVHNTLGPALKLTVRRA